MGCVWQVAGSPKRMPFAAGQMCPFFPFPSFIGADFYVSRSTTKFDFTLVIETKFRFHRISFFSFDLLKNYAHTHTYGGGSVQISFRARLSRRWRNDQTPDSNCFQALTTPPITIRSLPSPPSFLLRFSFQSNNFICHYLYISLHCNLHGLK